MDDPFNLERFLRAQDSEFEDAISELRQGCKRGHWMWFIFPQLRGLGRSSSADYYGISSRAEAEAYLKHPILGRRLSECATLVNLVEGRSIEAIFGGIDSKKFRSSMTLFAGIGPDQEIFERALEKYFSGRADPLTLGLLGDCTESQDS
jgi:uncharacterized protein (DUF1810 family)